MFFVDLLLIVISYILLHYSLSGWGNLILNLIKIKANTDLRNISSIWLGFILTVFVFNFLNLFIPINWITSFLFFTVGLYLQLKTYNIRITPILKSKINLIFTVLIAFIAIQLPYCYDQGLYHMNAIRWINEYSIVPGLANLHYRFGFNQSSFAYIAALNFHPYFNSYAFHIANSFLYLILGLQLLNAKNSISKMLLTFILFIPAPLFWIPTTSPDITSTILQIVIFYLFTLFIIKKDENYIYILLLLITSTITIKLSNTPFCISIFFSIFLIHRKHGVSKIIYILCLSVVFLWLIRGCIISGYLFFPSNIGKINTSWTVPENIRNIAFNAVYVFARLRSYEYESPKLNNYKWIPDWFENILYDIEGSSFEGFFSILCIIISILIIIYKMITNKKENKVMNVYFRLWITNFLCIVFWFFTAPDIRFANGLFIIQFTISIILLTNGCILSNLNKGVETFFTFFPFIFIFIFSIYYVRNGMYFFKGMYKLKKVPMKEVSILDDFKVLTPVQGDQTWDSKLPSSPYIDKNLRIFKNKTNLSFKIISIK